jgi:hypothetical protein
VLGHLVQEPLQVMVGERDLPVVRVAQIERKGRRCQVRVVRIVEVAPQEERAVGVRAAQPVDRVVDDGLRVAGRNLEPLELRAARDRVAVVIEALVEPETVIQDERRHDRARLVPLLAEGLRCGSSALVEDEVAVVTHPVGEGVEAGQHRRV